SRDRAGYGLDIRGERAAHGDGGRGRQPHPGHDDARPGWGRYPRPGRAPLSGGRVLPTERPPPTGPHRPEHQPAQPAGIAGRGWAPVGAPERLLVARKQMPGQATLSTNHTSPEMTTATVCASVPTGGETPRYTGAGVHPDRRAKAAGNASGPSARP